MYDFFYKTFNLSYLLNSTKNGNWKPKNRPVVVFIHGIAVDHGTWRPVIDELEDTPSLAIDLLGFGDSRKPDWPKYNLKDHAKALRATVRRHAPGRKVIICGHSLGSLVGIEYVKLYPKNVERLILCSPPIYRTKDVKRLPIPDKTLSILGKRFLHAIETSVRFESMVNSYKLKPKNFVIDPENKVPLIRTATNSILDQNSFNDLLSLENTPIDIIYGTLDPVMVPRNFKLAQKKCTNIKITTVLAGHDIRGLFAKRIAKLIGKK